jgi:hypothetical protein
MTATPRRRGVLALAGLGAAIVILALRSKGQTADALVYMLSAATGRELYHPHHLLYTPIVRFLYLALRALGTGADAILASQVHNTVLAVATGLATFSIVRRWGGSSIGAALTALALLATRGFWAYSTIADVYVPATACLAGVTLLLPRDGEAALGWKTPVVCALLALAIFYHQTNVLAVVPIAFWYASTRSPGKLRALALVLGGAGIVVLGAYVLAYLHSDAQAAMARMGVPSAPGFLEGFEHYCLSYTFHPNPEWGTFHNVSALGLGRVVHSQAWNVVVFDEATKYVVTGVFALALAIVLGWHVVQAVRTETLRRERIYLLLWLLIYDAFFLWWLPSEREFFITPLLPLVLAVWLLAADVSAKLPLRKVVVAAAALLLAGMIAINFASEILPAHRKPGLRYDEAVDIARVAPRDGVVFDSQPVIQSLRYYFGFGRVEEMALPWLHALEGEPIPHRFDFENEPSAWVPTSILDPDQPLENLGAYTNPPGFRAYLEWLLEVRPEAAGGVRYRHYRVMRPGGRGPYLLFDATREDAASFEELLARVDADVWSVRQGPLSKWWGTTHGAPRP